MSKWRFFSDAEVEGLKEDLIYKLDRAREFYGHPLIITSGYRDPAHNESVGGVSDSSHCSGQAVDLKAPIDPEMREKLAWSLGAAGFKRIGSYNKHFHVDTDRDKPTPAFWTGISH
jgi:zinc D-Ala-D-Ala carboxypeptidase